MTIVSNDTLLVHRILEQIEPWTPWYRRAWEGGSLLALREFSNSLRWVPEKVLAQSAIDRLARQIKAGLGLDAGFTGLAIRSQLDDLLRGKMVFSSQRHRQLDHLIQFTEARYFGAWRSHLSKADSAINVERAAQYLAPAVLDRGFEGEWLRKQINGLVKRGGDALDVLDELERLFNSEPTLHKGLVLIMEVSDQIELQKSPQWRSREATLAILDSWKDKRFDSIALVGALEFEVMALDPGSAAQIVAERITRFRTQLLFEAGSPTLVHDPYFRTPVGSKLLVQRRKAVLLRSRTASEKLRAGIVLTGHPTALDDALQLASPLTDGPDTLAASSAWASIESLLTDPSDGDERGFGGKAIAADRAAAILTAAWGRAELGRLSYFIADEAANARLHGQLSSIDETSDRAIAVYSWLRSGNSLSVIDLRSQQALNRMLELAHNPKTVLSRVQKQMNHALHRLYRQRNMVLHGGEVRPVGLASTLLFSGPLISAVLDQMIHAEQFHGVGPLALAARAEVSLAAGGADDAWDPARLLSP